MSEIVPDDQVEHVVGATRHRVWHIGRIVTAENRVYILHSETCKASGADLRGCEYSRALDRGLDAEAWAGREDEPVVLRFHDTRLVPGVAAADVAEGGGPR